MKQFNCSSKHVEESSCEELCCAIEQITLFQCTKKIPYANEVEHVCVRAIISMFMSEKLLLNEKLFHNSHWSSFMNENCCNE